MDNIPDNIKDAAKELHDQNEQVIAEGWKLGSCQNCGMVKPTRIFKIEDPDGNEVSGWLCKTCIQKEEGKKAPTPIKYSLVSDINKGPKPFVGSFWKPPKKEKKK